MNIMIYLKEKVKKALIALNVSFENIDIVIEKSKDLQHGDYATNVAMQLSRSLKKNPRIIAEELIQNIDKTNISQIEIAGPGFINFFVEPSFLLTTISKIINLGDNFGIKPIDKENKINVEFVSANPTGELHLGHARGAAIGDVICRLYTANGANVTREYYVNDAGVQILNLAKSLYVRYLQINGIEAELPSDGYHSPQLINVAQTLNQEVGTRFINDEENAIEYFKVKGAFLLLEIIKEDLKLFRVDFDVYSFETKVRANDSVEKLLQKLSNFTYEEDGAVLLKTSEFGDDKDRVIVKSNGEFTYFLPDIVYHLDKLSRGFTKLIDILGSDHHGYIPRMKAAIQMFGFGKATLDVELIQMVRLIKDNQEVKMSKRTGNAVTLRELVEDVGVDAVRYFFVSRASSSHLDFDLDLAKEASTANPVYYSQYAYARLYTVLQKGKNYDIDYSGTGLVMTQEITLVKHLIDYPLMIEDAAKTRSPYKVTNYIQKLSSLIHSFYTECRIVDSDNIPLSNVRLGLSHASSIVLKNALNLIGVSAKQHM